MTNFKTRVREFEEVLSTDFIDQNRLRKLSFEGVPEGSGIRSTVWRLLLGYLPPDRKTWTEYIRNKSQVYAKLLGDLVICDQPSADEEDHPLNPNPTSQWQTYFNDNQVLLQIDQDVRRLCPDISFFSQSTQFPNPDIVLHGRERLHVRVHKNSLSSQILESRGTGAAKLSNKKALSDHSVLGDACQEAHWEVVERILFLYAKLNPGQGYVQGMNEIIGPLYYVFACDSRKDWRANAESDCFFCFTNLMSDIRDSFIKTLDHEESGINGKMLRTLNRLRSLDPLLESRLSLQGIQPQFFLFRWMTLLLSQEFALPDVLRIWDSIFSDITHSDFLVDICTSMIILVKDEIMNNDFSENVKLLQNYPCTDLYVILSHAAKISSK